MPNKLGLPFTPYALDIETTDLAGSGQVIGWTLLNIVDGTYAQEFQSLPNVKDDDLENIRPLSEGVLLSMLHLELKDWLGKRLVTYNGESYKGGFDLPMLRRRYIECRLQAEWPFKGIKHLDMLPLVQQKINMTERRPITLEMLDATQLVELVNLCGLKPGKTKAANLELVNNGDMSKLQLVMDYCSKQEAQLKTDNSLDTVYDLLHGPDLGVAHIDGSKVPGMWQEYLGTGDEQIRTDLMRYNLSDCQQLAFVFKQLYPLLSEDVEREWRRL
jgi:uncharacterized protein YprB with RNaseH-like and TPR domain